jgi:hypothetical protein
MPEGWVLVEVAGGACDSQKFRRRAGWEEWRS